MENPKVLAHAIGARCRRSPEEIAALLGEYRSSGLSQKSFAAARGVNFSTFTSWLQRFKSPDAMPSSGSQRLVRVQVANAPASQALLQNGFEIVLPTGVLLRVPPDFEEVSFRRLLGALTDQC